jgi:hypothetical protein
VAHLLQKLLVIDEVTALLIQFAKATLSERKLMNIERLVVAQASIFELDRSSGNFISIVVGSML